MFRLVIGLFFLSILQINQINSSDKLVELTTSKILNISKPQELDLANPVAAASHLAAVSATQAEAFDLMLAARVCGELKESEVKPDLLSTQQEQALASFVYSPVETSTKPAHKHKVPSDLKDFVDSSGSSGDYAKMLEKVLDPIAKK